MNLKDFITETLVTMSNAIIDANQTLEGKGAYVNPRGLFNHQDEGKNGYILIDNETTGWPHATMIDFDVAVTASDESETSKGVGLGIKVVNAGIEGKNVSSTSRESRIRFKIPIALPVSQIPKGSNTPRN